MTDDALLEDLVDRLSLVRRELGPRVFREALTAGRVAVARAILRRTERRLGLAGECGLRGKSGYVASRFSREAPEERR